MTGKIETTRSNIYELSSDYSITLTNISLDVIVRKDSKQIKLEQHFQRRGDGKTSAIAIALNEEETKDLYEILKEMYDGAR